MQRRVEMTGERYGGKLDNLYHSMSEVASQLLERAGDDVSWAMQQYEEGNCVFPENALYPILVAKKGGWTGWGKQESMPLWSSKVGGKRPAGTLSRSLAFDWAAGEIVCLESYKDHMDGSKSYNNRNVAEGPAALGYAVDTSGLTPEIEDQILQEWRSNLEASQLHQQPSFLSKLIGVIAKPWQK